MVLIKRLVLLPYTKKKMVEGRGKRESNKNKMFGAGKRGGGGGGGEALGTLLIPLPL